MRRAIMILAMLLASGAARGDITPRPATELRAVWIASVANMDWPSRVGLTAAEQQAELVTLFDHVQATNMNAVFVQVRPCADAFFPSRHAPWSVYLSGTQGQDPGYDPLAFMIREAHRRKLQLHAWFNPYRVSAKDDPAELAPSNPARLHPEWVVSYGGKLYFDPGLPAVRKLLVASIMEVVQNYDIDGVHFDDYFYPYPVPNQPFPDAETYQQYGAAAFPDITDWRRDNVNRLIRDLSARIRAIRPALRFGISPFGVWRNKAADPTGSDTTASVSTYDDLYADTRTWIRRGWIDYIAPQIYWNIGFAPAAYDKLVRWWSNEVAGTNVHVYVGHSVYKIGANNPAWANPDEMPNQLALNKRYPAVRGSIFFNLKSLLANPLGFRDRLIRDCYRELVPPPGPDAERGGVRP